MISYVYIPSAGEQLESLHQLRSLAQSSSLLLSYYLSLAQPLPTPISTQKKSSVDADGNPIEPADGEAEAPQTPLEILFATRTSREGRTRLAIILRRLSTLAKDVADSAAAALASAQEGPGPGSGGTNGNGATDEKEEKKKLARMKADVDKAEEVRAEVEKYAERFEKECLRLFDRSYRKGDVRMMAVSEIWCYRPGTACGGV